MLLASRIAHSVGEERPEALMAAWEAEGRARGPGRDGVEFWTEVEPWMATATTLPVRR